MSSKTSWSRNCLKFSIPGSSEYTAWHQAPFQYNNYLAHFIDSHQRCFCIGSLYIRGEGYCQPSSTSAPKETHYTYPASPPGGGALQEQNGPLGSDDPQRLVRSARQVLSSRHRYPLRAHSPVFPAHQAKTLPLIGG